MTQICKLWRKCKKNTCISALVAIPDREQLCVCVCMYACYAWDSAWGIPFFLVSRETALFCQAIYLRVLTKIQEAWLYTLYSVQPSNVWLYPKPWVSDTTTCVWLDCITPTQYVVHMDHILHLVCIWASYVWRPHTHVLCMVSGSARCTKGPKPKRAFFAKIFFFYFSCDIELNLFKFTLTSLTIGSPLPAGRQTFILHYSALRSQIDSRNGFLSLWKYIPGSLFSPLKSQMIVTQM